VLAVGEDVAYLELRTLSSEDEMADNIQPSRATRGEDLETLRADIATLRADVERLTGTLKNIGGAAVESARRRGTEAVERVKTEAGHLAENVAAAGRTQVADLERRIKEQPLLAIGVAFGIGAILAKLLDRRR
jgi:ElaB/YqjD/DUF883 family membrane-anchored ribosome-binding protein